MSTESEKKVVVTWVRGDRADKFHARYSSDLHRYAIRTTGRTAVVLTHPVPAIPARCPSVGKWAAYDLLGRFDRYLWADADVEFAADAPDLFALTPAGFLGAPVEAHWHGGDGTLAGRIARLSALAGVPPVDPGLRFASAGVYVADRLCLPWLTRHPRPQDFFDRLNEQDWQQRCAVNAGRLHLWPESVVYTASTDPTDARTRPVRHYAGRTGPQ